MSTQFTPGEERVAAYIRSPMTYAGIARVLYLSEETVKTHMKAIYRKLGVGSRAQARVALATKGGPS